MIMNKTHLTGYVNVSERNSRELRDSKGLFIEKVASGAFTRALKENPNVEIRLNHSRVLKVDYLHLEEDNIGLKVDVIIDDAEIRSATDLGALQGWSFAFTPISDNWETIEERRYRTLCDFHLHEISILTVLPAYIATSVESRAGLELRSSDADISEVVNTADEVLTQLNMKKKRFDLIKKGI